MAFVRYTTPGPAQYKESGDNKPVPGKGRQNQTIQTKTTSSDKPGECAGQAARQPSHCRQPITRPATTGVPKWVVKTGREQIEEGSGWDAEQTGEVFPHKLNAPGTAIHNNTGCPQTSPGKADWFGFPG